MYQLNIQIQGGVGTSIETVAAMLDKIKANFLVGNTQNTMRSEKIGYTWEAREVDSDHANQSLLTP